MKTKKTNDARILVDTIKDPRDMAEIIHLAIATNREVDVTGNSISHTHPKVLRQIDAWKPGFRKNPSVSNVHYEHNFFDRIKYLKSIGYTIIGTSPHFGESLFHTNFAKGNQLIVFGTEVGGLSKEKMAVMEKIVNVPMLNQTRFYTLRTILPIVIHEVLRQKGFFGKPKK
ncbi:MAG: TrmH family RNA methyltransferase [Candidatus Diapherotrites archaeon]